MCPSLANESNHESDDGLESQCQLHQGVKMLYEKGVNKVPTKYILPMEERPKSNQPEPLVAKKSLKLPVIDLAELKGPNRVHALQSLANACQQYGFFQVINHGIPNHVYKSMVDVSTRFFNLPYEERSKYMSSDLRAPVRYGTSFNQNQDQVFCWRDFVKLLCHPLSDFIPYWPSSPVDFRNVAATYAKETKHLFLIVMDAILESLSGANSHEKTGENDQVMKEFKDGSHLMVVNCYPPCPEPDLTLGMPPHSDYGFLTLLLQDEVEGLQIQHHGNWVTVEPIPNSFVVNVGDHLEIFSNGRYKSVLHRVKVNAAKSRISVASLHSLSFKQTVSPWPRLINETNPRRYRDTDFASFLEYISSRDPKKKDFLESRKLL